MDKILTILHTSQSTIRLLGDLAASLLPADVSVRNLLDDSLLNDTRAAGYMTDEVAQRIVSYLKLAESQGADCVLMGCSSVGPAVDRARSEVKIPVIKIDEPMAQAAVKMGPKIAILATVATTLEPTRQLVEAMAAKEKTEIEINTVLCDEAFDLLEKGDVEGHNRLLIGKINENIKSADVVLLAQASMTNILPDLSPKIKERVLTSPRLGMERVAQLLGS